MKKYNKKQMTKFDYKIRSFVIFAILIFVRSIGGKKHE